MDMDEERHVIRFDVAYSFWGYELRAESVSAELGVKPSGAYSRDNPFVRSDGVACREDHGFWTMHTNDAVTSDRLDDHVRYLVELLEPRAAAVSRLRRSSDLTCATIYCSSRGNVAHLSVSGDLVARLAPFVDEVGFSFVAGSVVRGQGDGSGSLR